MVKNNITIMGARIIFRDFSGEKNRYNNDRTFTVVLEDEVAKRLKEDGWPVRYLEPRNEDEQRLPILSVKVYFGGKVPPQVVMITGGKKKELFENDIHMLDWANFDNVDVKIRPFNYDINGKKGVKAYLKSLWVTIAEDELENKYRDIPYATDIDENGNSDEEPLPFN